MKVDNSGNSDSQEKLFSEEKNTAQNKKVEKTDPPNHPKYWSTWQSQVILSLVWGVMAN